VQIPLLLPAAAAIIGGRVRWCGMEHDAGMPGERGWVIALLGRVGLRRLEVRSDCEALSARLEFRLMLFRVK
jgi:hypothetical protein